MLAANPTDRIWGLPGKKQILNYQRPKDAFVARRHHRWTTADRIIGFAWIAVMLLIVGFLLYGALLARII